MKNWVVRIEYYGLTGKYFSDVEVQARTQKAAEKKAALTIGNRDGHVVFSKVL